MRSTNSHRAFGSLNRFPETLLQGLRLLCPIENHWSDTEEYLSESDPFPSKLQIYKEEGGTVSAVYFKYSLASDPLGLLEKFMLLARQHHCLLLEVTSKALMEPTRQIVIPHLLQSRAMQFVQNPTETILQAAREVQEQERREAGQS